MELFVLVEINYIGNVDTAAKQIIGIFSSYQLAQQHAEQYYQLKETEIDCFELNNIGKLS